MITIKELSVLPEGITQFQTPILNEVACSFPKGKISALVGPTGSGKSTLLYALSGLFSFDDGVIKDDDLTLDPFDSEKLIYEWRKRFGFLFQFSEMQLFEETVLDDVQFAPLNYGFTDADAKNSGKDALRLLNIEKKYWKKSPFALSGGQMKRVAIAGVLAAKPRILVLDEPTVGLDKTAKDALMQLLQHLVKTQQLTIVFATHDMDVVSELADHIVVLNKGEKQFEGTVQQLFENETIVMQNDLTYPQTIEAYLKLVEKFPIAQIEQWPITERDFLDWYHQYVKGGLNA